MTRDPFAVIAPFYDWEHERFLDDLPLYRGFARHCGGAVLELACGTGRLLLPLAQQGVEIVGLDSSDGMLAVAREKLGVSGISPERASVAQADLTSFELSRPFALAFIALDSFGLLLRRADQLEALERIRAHLSDGGLLLVDVSNGNLKAGGPGPELHHQLTAPFGGDGQVLTKFAARDVDLSEQLERYTYFYDLRLPDGAIRRSVASLELRYFTRFELELLLERAGYAVETLYGSYDLQPFDPFSERLIVAARRA